MTAQAGDTFFLKAQLRKELRLLRSRLPLSFRRQAARRAALALLRVPEVRRARRVALFLSVGSEIDTQAAIDLCRARGIEVYVPRLAGRAMRFVRLEAHTALRRNRFGIREPVGRLRTCAPARLDVIVLPLVGFDAQGARLGAGGGFYDRTLAPLAGRRRPLRAGLAYAAQQIAHVPRETWDLPLHAVVTEKGVRRWPTG